MRRPGHLTVRLVHRARVRRAFLESTPPMNRSSRVLAAAALLAVAVPLAGPSGPAVAESHRAQLTYTCDAAPQGYENQSTAYPFVVAMRLDTPARISPGQQLRISGVLSVQFPEQLRSLAASYFTYAQAISDVLTVPVTVNGRTTTLKASRFDSGRVATKAQPLVLSSPFTTPAFTVPKGASGAVEIALPANNTVKSNLDAKQVAFHTEALLSGGTVGSFYDKYVYKAACTAPANAQRTVARIPVAAPAPEVAAPSAGTTAPAAPVAPVPSASAGARPGTATGTVSAAPGAPTAPGTAAPVAVPTQVVGASDLRALANARSDDSRVPGWAVGVGAGLVIGVAVLVAGWSHHRVRMLRVELEG